MIGGDGGLAPCGQGPGDLGRGVDDAELEDYVPAVARGAWRPGVGPPQPDE